MPYLGYVYGTLVALKRMLPRDRGSIVRVGSALAYREFRVRVQEAMEAHDYDREGFFHVDRHQHHIAWGTDGTHQYRGWFALQYESRRVLPRMNITT